MSTHLYTHKACLQHDTGPYHPECSDRLRHVLMAMGEPEFAALVWHESRQASVEELARVHPQQFVERFLQALPDEGSMQIDNDTVVSGGSREAALRAAGAVCEAVEAVMRGEARNAFCAVRPPGHHAEPRRPMGFCLFNNVAVGALHARAAFGLERVAVIDFDVHHGNGTQAVAQREPGLFFASTHQDHLYPNTGLREETGTGNICNRPLDAGTASIAFRKVMTEEVLPEVEAWRPEMILISAGFDAHAGDPMAFLELQDEDYHWVTQAICDVAARVCGGRVVSTMEGGYDIDSLVSASKAHVRALMAA